MTLLRAPAGRRRGLLALLAAALFTLAGPAFGASDEKPKAKQAAAPHRGRIGGVRMPRKPLAPGDRISLDLKDADIRDVIRTFAELARINVVIDPEVRGSVTVRLHGVRWEDALDVILRSNGLGAVREENLVQVAAPARLAGEDAR